MLVFLKTDCRTAAKIRQIRSNSAHFLNPDFINQQCRNITYFCQCINRIFPSCMRNCSKKTKPYIVCRKHPVPKPHMLDIDHFHLIVCHKVHIIYAACHIHNSRFIWQHFLPDISRHSWKCIIITDCIITGMIPMPCLYLMIIFFWIAVSMIKCLGNYRTFFKDLFLSKHFQNIKLIIFFRSTCPV